MRTGHREQWQPGDTAWFEYHCLEAAESPDAPVWYRSHQRVTVLSLDRNDAPASSTFTERSTDGTPYTYRVRFSDGLEWDVFEDELFTGPEHFQRPDPPEKPSRTGPTDATGAQPGVTFREGAKNYDGP